MHKLLAILCRNSIIVSSAAFVALLTSNVLAQRIAILTPDKNVRDVEYADRIADELRVARLRVLDTSQSDVAYRSVQIPNTFNMTTAEARSAAAVIGCDYFLIVRTGGQRRVSSAKPEYYEAFAVQYLVSGRSGELASWSLNSFDADTQSRADANLAASVSDAAKQLVDKIRSTVVVDIQSTSIPPIEEVPAEGSPSAVGLKAPIPYRRIKPEYTTQAFLYDVRATVDLEADIDADGKILVTRIVRWAGFGLDESVEKAVRTMNWRPAMRNGKPLPMRVLLRYNFTKVDKE